MTGKIRLFAALLIPAALLLLGCDDPKQPTPPDPSAGSTILVANYAGGAGYISTIDVENQSVRLGAAGLGNTPNDIVFKGSNYYVLNSVSADINVLTVSNQNTITSVDTIDAGRARGFSPQYAAFDARGDLYITNFNNGTVEIMDAGSDAFSLSVSVGLGPQEILAVGDKVYVCVSGYDRVTGTYSTGSVKIISTTSSRVITTIPVGWNPQYMTLDNERNLHVSCTGDYGAHTGEIYRINTRADSIDLVVAIGGSPGDIAVTREGFGYVASWGDQNGGHVYRYNTRTGQILNRPANPIVVSKGAMRIIAAPDNSVYVACYEADKVDRVVGNSRRESYSVGDGPGAMFFIDR